MVQEQWKFLQDIAKLIERANELGFVLTSGEFWRTPVQAWINALPPHSNIHADIPNSTTDVHYTEEVGGRGISKSLHLSRLAADFNIFKDGGIVSNPDTLKPLGDYWQSLDPKNRWGGFFKTRLDLPHFERNVV